MSLKTVVFTSGMSVMIVEILASRLIAPYFGNSIFVWTSIIGVILASLSIGYYFGGRLADREPSPTKLSFALLYAGLTVSFIPSLSTPVLLLSIPLGLKYGALASAIILLSIPSILLGTVSPYAIKLETEKLKILGRTAGSLYAISTLGSIVGTFLTGFYLIPNFGVKSIIYFVSILLIASSLLVSLKKMIPYVSAVLIVLALIIFYIAPKTQALESPDIVVTYDTPYSRIAVRDNAHGVRDLFLDSGCQGGIFLDSHESAHPYSYFFPAPLAFKDDVDDILFIGTGTGVTQMDLRRLNPRASVDSVDIDPDVNRVAKTYFGLVEDENLRLHSQDGRFYLAGSEKKYDLIVLDAFASDPSTPPHLVTSEFMLEVKNHLKDDGFFMSNLIGAPYGEYSSFLKSFVKTLSLHFTCNHIFPVNKDPESIQNVIVLSYNPAECPSKEDVRTALNSLPQNPFVDWSSYNRNLVPEDIDLTEAFVFTDDYAPVESLQLPLSEKILQRDLR